jgi:uncharacterized protein
MSAATPVQPSERIVTLDIIRGFALLGILVMNLQSFSGADEPATLSDRAADVFTALFFSGKFNSLFSLLFAIGFTIQLGRLRQRAPASAVSIYLRRLAILLAFGLLHAVFVWDGDVLHLYAVLGVVLLIVGAWPDRAIYALVAAGLLYPGLRSLALMLFASPAWTQGRVATQQAFRDAVSAAHGSGTYWDVVTQNLHSLQFFYTTGAGVDQLLLGGYVLFSVTMLIGLLAGRHQWIQRAADHPSVVRRVQWSALGVGIATGILFVIASRFVQPFVPSIWFVLMRTAYGVSRVALMIFYVATILRMTRHGSWMRRLRPLAATGRMPLTNYLFQSVLCTFIFDAWGLGYWGRAGALAQLVLAFAIFLLIQVPFSAWWFRRHAYGPMEYLWRLLTYGHKPEALAQPQGAT